jgi:hypothetical protein
MRIRGTVMRTTLLFAGVVLAGSVHAVSFVGFGCDSAQHTSLHVGDHVVFSGNGWPGPTTVYWDDVPIATYPGPGFTNYDGTCDQGTGNPYFTTVYIGLSGDRLLPLTSARPADAFPFQDPSAQALEPFEGDTTLSGSAKTTGALTLGGNLMLGPAVLSVNGDLWIENGIGHGTDGPGGASPRATGAIFVNGRAVVHGPVFLAPDDTETIFAQKDVYLCGNGTYSAGPCAKATSGDVNGDGVVASSTSPTSST